MEYCISEFKRCIESLILDGRTPFIFPDLYQDMPETYQDLIGMCSLYMQRTPQKLPVVYRMMDIKAKKLIDSEPSLLGVHALIMYQIIRLAV